MTAFLSALILVLFFDHSLTQNNLRGHDCDFEDDKCNWKWNTSIPNGFGIYSGEDMHQYFKNEPMEYKGPLVDANNNTKGK